jgi:hypothetical protein
VPATTGPAAGVTLTTDSGCYHPGDTVVITLENLSERIVGYNLCGGFIPVERLEDGTWQGVKMDSGLDDYPNAAHACTGEMHLLQTGQHDAAQRRFPPEMPSGRYRLRTEVSIDVNAATGLPESYDIYTNEFEVE